MGAAAVSGTWTSSCLSTQRGDTQTPYYAKSYTFTLDASATVTVTAASTDHTPVLHVLSTTGDPQDHKEDAPDKFELAAGDYAVEVTTTTARATLYVGMPSASRQDRTRPTIFRERWQPSDPVKGRLSKS